MAGTPVELLGEISTKLDKLDQLPDRLATLMRGEGGAGSGAAPSGGITGRTKRTPSVLESVERLTGALGGPIFGGMSNAMKQQRAVEDAGSQLYDSVFAKSARSKAPAVAKAKKTMLAGSSPASQLLPSVMRKTMLMPGAAPMGTGQAAAAGGQTELLSAIKELTGAIQELKPKSGDGDQVNESEAGENLPAQRATENIWERQGPNDHAGTDAHVPSPQPSRREPDVPSAADAERGATGGDTGGQGGMSFSDIVSFLGKLKK